MKKKKKQKKKRKKYRTPPKKKKKKKRIFLCPQDILKILNIPHASVLELSFDRPNLTYSVVLKDKPAEEAMAQLAEIITSRFPHQCGIVYCLSKNECADVASFLAKECQVAARHYHAGMGIGERMAVQRMWRGGEVKVICATIAFGMGIDKPDVVPPLPHHP